MSFKKQTFFFQMKTASLQIFCIIIFIPFYILCYSHAIFQLSLWEKAVVSISDILCRITTPNEFTFLCLAIMLFFLSNQQNYTFFANYVVRAESRTKLYWMQIGKILRICFFIWGWIMLSSLFIGSLFSPLLINWDQYNSVYYRNCYNLNNCSFYFVLTFSGASLLLTMVTSALWTLISHWKTGSIIPGWIVFVIVYFWDARQPVQYSLYFKRFSLDYANLVSINLIGVTLIVQFFVMLTLIAIGNHVVLRRDII